MKNDTIEDTIAKIKELVTKSKRILVTSHLRPDGDAVGSVLAFGLALENANKDAHMVLSDGVPSSFRHLDGYEKIDRNTDGDYDLIIVLDSSDAERPGEAIQGYNQVHVNIDHHVTNEYFAKVNLVDSNAVATAEVLAELFPEIGLPVDVRVASALINGIVTDTLGFRTENMTPKALRVTADLMELGVNLPFIYQKSLTDHNFYALKYWGAGLNSLERKNGLVWATLSLDDRKSVNYPGRDDADLSNVISTIEDADITIIFVEQSSDRVKVSWRSRGDHDVSQIAYRFGGGGHKPAAGAEVSGKLEDVKEMIITETYKLL